MTDEPTATSTDAMFALADRVRAVLRLISPDHITPIGVRQIERVLDEETEAAAYAQSAADMDGPARQAVARRRDTPIPDDDVTRAPGPSSVPPLD